MKQEAEGADQWSCLGGGAGKSVIPPIGFYRDVLKTHFGFDISSWSQHLNLIEGGQV